MPALKQAEARQRMKTVPGWTLKGKALSRTFEFAGFMGSIAFVNTVAAAAEARDHHPDIDVRWNRVTLVLSTHSEGGLTGKDFAMARQCSGIFSRRKRAL